VRLAILIIALVVIVGAGSMVAVGMSAYWRHARPGRDDWERARRRLGTGDQLRVRRATMRCRPVERPDLASAQLIFSRYAESEAERSPLRGRPLRIAFCVLYAALAAMQIVNGLAQTQQRPLFLGCGALFAVMAVLYGPLVRRSLDRRPAEMRRLRRRVAERYPDQAALP
jgi:hypothetical protein